MATSKRPKAAKAAKAATPAKPPAPRYFATPALFRAWLAAHHERRDELWVGFYKRDSGKPSITWPESVDQALCFGWIDGVRKSLGPTAYVIRFTRRRPTSIWSDINTRKVGELTAAGLMAPAGLAAFAKRNEKRSGVYSFERDNIKELGAAEARALRANAKAFAYWSAQAPWYRRVTSFYVMSAKKEETRARRLATLIADSAAGRRIGILERPGGK